MAKSISKKPKKLPVNHKMSKGAVLSMNRGAYGDEYEFDRPIDNRDASIAFNWYSLNCDRKQAAYFVTAYLEKVGRTEDLSRIKKISDGRVRGFVGTGCWIARMWTKGITFIDQEKHLRIFEEGLQRVYDFVESDDSDEATEDEDGNITVSSSSVRQPTKMKRPRNGTERTPAEKAFDRYLEVLNIAADAIEKGDQKFDVVELLRVEELDPLYVEDMLSELSEIEAGLKASFASPDEHETKLLPRIKKQKPVASSVVYGITKFQTEKKTKKKIGSDGVEVPRKARKKKVVSVDKLVSRMKFQEKDEDLGLTSIPPVKVVGALELWVYNTRYANLTVYRAKDENGLSVRGTTLLNFDEVRSESKKIGRYSKKYTEDVTTAGKIQLRKLMETIKSTPTKPNGRINENTVLLRTS